MAKKKSLTAVKDKVWKLFSRYIRLRDRLVEDGVVTDYCPCCSCGRVYDLKQMQAGHFIPGRRNSNLFDDRGCHAQCYSCNMHKNGNWPGYYEFMLKTYGQSVIDDLLKQNKELLTFDENYLQTLASRLKTLISSEEAR
jgi:5-methylcytosine-specific restriction endonuclease McrA